MTERSSASEADKWPKSWAQWIGGTLIGVILAGAPAAFFVLPQLSAVAATLSELERRVTKLEKGDTTPISREATARIDSLSRDIARLRGDVQRLAEGQQRIYDRLLDGKHNKGG